MKLVLALCIAIGIGFGVWLALILGRDDEVAPRKPSEPPAPRVTWKRIHVDIPFTDDQRKLALQQYNAAKADEARTLLAAAVDSPTAVEQIHAAIAIMACEAGEGADAANEAAQVSESLRVPMVYQCASSGIQIIDTRIEGTPAKHSWQSVTPVVQVSAETKSQLVATYRNAKTFEADNIVHARDVQARDLIHFSLAQTACTAGLGDDALAEAIAIVDSDTQVKAVTACALFGIKLSP